MGNMGDRGIDLFQQLRLHVMYASKYLLLEATYWELPEGKQCLQLDFLDGRQQRQLLVTKVQSA